MKRRPGPVLVLGCVSLAVWLAGVSAHTRARPHVHRQATPRAVVVVSPPRPAKRVVVVDGLAHGALDLNVKPRSSEVWVDGNLRGTADAFDGFPAKLYLRPGVHRLELVTPDGERASREIRVQAGVELNVGLDLR